jgi:hypothetical protein
MDTGVSVRTLASPGFVLALVLLILNDHLLKRVYPGVLTGKLSDVAGLVVAPLLLGVLLTAWRVRRPLPVAIALTGVGFTLTKASAAGAALASTAWNLTGVPTLIRADVTDLLALPALYAAWLVHRQALSGPGAGIRETVATATGVALLPFAVLATAATDQDCGDYVGLDTVVVVEGAFTGTPGIERRVIVDGATSVDVEGEVAALPEADRERLPRRAGSAYDDGSACDAAGSCWRVTSKAAARVEISHDGGKTWAADYQMTDEEADDAVEGVDLPCDHEPVATARGLAVLDESSVAHVVVAASHAGILLRSSAGAWRLVSTKTLDDLTRPPEPTPTPHIRRVPPSFPPEELKSRSPEPGVGTTRPTALPCESPTTVSVTPDPRNGPPTTNVYCP